MNQFAENAITSMPETIAPCAVVPLYNHAHRIADIITALHDYKLPVIVVDDGSNETTRQALRNLEKLHNTGTLHIYYMPHNNGKGAAVLKGLDIARSLGFSHAVQIDADGQHTMEKIPDMLAFACKNPTALVSGKPVYNESIPKSRLYGRYITHFWVAIETLSRQLEDTMCGLRVYPIELTLSVNSAHPAGLRMEFDTEIMVRLYWAGCPVYFFAVAVDYPADGLSHFRPFADNWRISCMHTRLVCGMLIRAPRLLARRFKSNSMPATPHSYRQWSTIRERGSLSGMRVVSALYRLLGRRVCSLLLGPITFYFFLTHKIARQASQNFLRRVHPYTQNTAWQNSRPGAWNRLRHFYSFASSLLDKIAVWGTNRQIEIPEMENRQCLQKALAKNRGLLLISAHIGNIEVCRALAALNNHIRINALVYTQNAKKFNHLLENLNTRYQFRLLLVEKIGMDTGVMLREMIDRGEIVVIVGDRTPINEGAHTVQADFLGQSAHFATGPYILAHILECPVQLLFCVKNNKKHIIHIEDFENRVHLPRKQRQQEIARLAQRYADRLASYAAQYPLQWFNFFDFWAAPGSNNTESNP